MNGKSFPICVFCLYVWLHMCGWRCRPYPEDVAVYKERSPINSLDSWTIPTAFFQASSKYLPVALVHAILLEGCQSELDTSKVFQVKSVSLRNELCSSGS